MTRKPKKDTLYKIAISTGANGFKEFQVFKLDNDFEHIGTYKVSQIAEKSFVCNCPAWKSPCKHVKIVQRIVAGECGSNPYTLSVLYSLNKDAFINPQED